jgi:twitching motility two-component system response regulator PilH
MAADNREMAKVLLVDDNELLRTTIVRMLTPEGHQVLTAANREDALQIWELEKPDVAICDVNLPRSVPAAVIGALRSRDSQLKILAISGDDIGVFHESMTDVVARIGADSFLRKPFRRSELFEALQQVGIGSRPTARVTLAEGGH